ncbi:hypothetical protein C5L14_28835 [Labrys okinawensis]|uniref:Uncharacterized protein n=1 Tax=Labrys okinawensis TaxID=346911 RepID=A0A2S9Q468_9HYPH|nr:hypothetical protein C5L14_28835 [Labrys okinawensis]
MEGLSSHIDQDVGIAGKGIAGLQARLAAGLRLPGGTNEEGNIAMIERCGLFADRARIDKTVVP